ncbi:MAG: RNA polymerase subunit sigma-70 [Balneolaceae bacterium]|jgi:RNA polymerase sigma factor (TIGR02999 family)|nr:MAG: RNA polymerase subunit sigma-70 [Balneolaceae bacterium]
MTEGGEITRLLAEVSEGNRESEKKLITLVYDQLYQLAGKNRRMWNQNETLNTTALVHEAYLKMISQTNKEWKSRVHFFSVASKAMRCILVDHAKKQNAIKRGKSKRDLPLNEMLLCPPEKADEVIALDEALIRLEKIDENHSKIVEYRFFCGFNIEETAQLMETSTATVKRGWGLARSWLYKEMQRSSS